jgi:hypothetical protein
VKGITREDEDDFWVGEAITKYNPILGQNAALQTNGYVMQTEYLVTGYT